MEVVAQEAEVELRSDETQLVLECAQHFVLRGGDLINPACYGIEFDNPTNFDVSVNGVTYTMQLENAVLVPDHGSAFLQGSMKGTRSGNSREDDTIFVLFEVGPSRRAIQKYVAVDYDEWSASDYDCYPAFKALLP